ncbi:GAF and ANTAR domain-containing protein [Nocardioides sp. Kera G14]|uniref:GAF and ANTAR domain-containing protein n=1 Tax=Nocardioides sp. Kera G14 TaxID=2884264 RepID=UPI001D0FDF51|nr:GAF and ANTAR domain-containing protein [Nocardioides sp. Kera G14]UDY25187.1 GAF and ANTAR domain-containing protein [Nocardioides sp. Kera G14]
MGNPSELASSLAAAAEAINAAETLSDTLEAIARATRISVPGFDHVGISIRHRDGRIETMAGTSELVWDLDNVQYRLDEGPCVDAIRAAPVVAVPHLRHDQRWPRYVPEAVQRGLRAQLAVQLFSDDERLGGLNLYSTVSEEIDDDAVHAAQLFATHAAIALGRAQHEENLNQALTSRKVIGQAIGILMERYGIDEDRAFQFMVRASSAGNIKLRDVAEDLVSGANGRSQRN